MKISRKISFPVGYCNLATRATADDVQAMPASAHCFKSFRDHCLPVCVGQTGVGLNDCVWVGETPPFCGFSGLANFILLSESTHAYDAIFMLEK